MSSIKQQRIAGRIRQVLSELLLTEVSDPRLSDVTVTEVKVDREIRFATVYLAGLGGDTRQEDVMNAIEGASGYLRHELAQRLQTRHTPALRFVWDPLLEQANRIESLLDALDIPEPVEGEDESS